MVFSYACLFPLSSVDYSFPNRHGVSYHIDASVIPTILDVPLLFLNFGTITLSVHSSGIFSCSKIFWSRYSNISTPSSPKLFQTSTGIPSGPIAFPCLIALIATSTSFMLIGHCIVNRIAVVVRPTRCAKKRENGHDK